MTAPEKPFFFLHVMKTGGTSFVSQVQANFAPEHQFPSPDLDGAKHMAAYIFFKPLQDLTDEQRDRIQLYCGHLPFLATTFVGRPVTVLTILREPVARTISHLRHIKRAPSVGGVVPQQRFRDMTLEEIYEDPDRYQRFLHDFQVKMFAMTAEDGLTNSAAPLEVDDAHLTVAKQNLEQVDVLGLNRCFGEFVDEVQQRFGWDVSDGPKMQVSTDDWDVSDSFLARIARDNEADVEFYRYAEELYARRRAAGS